MMVAYDIFQTSLTILLTYRPTILTGSKIIPTIPTIEKRQKNRIQENGATVCGRFLYKARCKA